MTQGMTKALERRHLLFSRLMVALAPCSKDVALSVVTAYISLDVLEEIVKVQEA